MNPPVLDIFNKQKYNKIIVGDPNQQIYMFRGAVNALESIDATHTYHLTQRFVEFHAKDTKAGLCHLKIVLTASLLRGSSSCQNEF